MKDKNIVASLGIFEFLSCEFSCIFYFFSCFGDCYLMCWNRSPLHRIGRMYGFSIYEWELFIMFLSKYVYFRISSSISCNYETCSGSSDIIWCNTFDECRSDFRHIPISQKYYWKHSFVTNILKNKPIMLSCSRLKKYLSWWEEERELFCSRYYKFFNSFFYVIHMIFYKELYSYIIHIS